MHAPIVEDPDLRDALDTFLPTVIEVRQLSAQLFTLDLASPDRVAVEDWIQDKMGAIAQRCERLAVTLDGFLQLANAEILAQRLPNDHRPSGEHLRALLDENTRAYGAERQLHRELTLLQGRLAKVTGERIAADRACAGYVAGWAERGRA